MFLGRAGLMAYYAKKKLSERRNQPKHQWLIDHQKKFQTQQSKKRRNKGIMFHSSTPKGAWFLGLTFIAASCFLIYVLQTGMLEDDGPVPLSPEELHKQAYERKGIPTAQVTGQPVSYWWRYMLIMFMGTVGVLFLVSVDRETVEIHKEHKLLVLGKMNPWLCCRKKTVVRDLELLTDMGLVKRGHESTQNSTVYYAIEFRYGELLDKNVAARREEVMEFTDMRTAKCKYVEVMTFLERVVDLANVRISDESTSQKKKPTPARRSEASPLIRRQTT